MKGLGGNPDVILFIITFRAKGNVFNVVFQQYLSNFFGK